MFIRYILYVSIFCMLPLFSYAAENKSADYDFSSNQLTFKNAKGEVIRTFTIQELQELFPQKIYDTEVPPWGESTRSHFRGPRIKDILEKLGLSVDSDIRITAWDDYSVKILGKNIKNYDPIFAIEIICNQNDYKSNICSSDQKFRFISDFEKGPIRIIWPVDQISSESFSPLNKPWIFSIRAVQVLL